MLPYKKACEFKNGVHQAKVYFQRGWIVCAAHRPLPCLLTKIQPNGPLLPAVLTLSGTLLCWTAPGKAVKAKTSDRGRHSMPSASECHWQLQELCRKMENLPCCRHCCKKHKLVCRAERTPKRSWMCTAPRYYPARWGNPELCKPATAQGGERCGLVNTWFRAW